MVSISVDRDPVITSLHQSSESFRRNDVEEGKQKFQSICGKSDIENKIYWQMWIVKGRPSNVCYEFGRNSFWDAHGYSSTATEKALAIDAYLESQALRESANKARVEYDYEYDANRMEIVPRQRVINEITDEQWDNIHRTYERNCDGTVSRETRNCMGICAITCTVLAVLGIAIAQPH